MADSTHLTFPYLGPMPCRHAGHGPYGSADLLIDDEPAASRALCALQAGRGGSHQVCALPRGVRRERVYFSRCTWKNAGLRSSLTRIISAMPEPTTL
jgi:hypothetical protein